MLKPLKARAGLPVPAVGGRLDCVPGHPFANHAQADAPCEGDQLVAGLIVANEPRHGCVHGEEGIRISLGLGQSEYTESLGGRGEFDLVIALSERSLDPNDAIDHRSLPTSLLRAGVVPDEVFQARLAIADGLPVEPRRLIGSDVEGSGGNGGQRRRLGEERKGRGREQEGCGHVGSGAGGGCPTPV